MGFNAKEIDAITEALREMGGTDAISSLLDDVRKHHGLSFSGNLADFEAQLQKAGFQIKKKLRKAGSAVTSTYVSLP